MVSIGTMATGLTYQSIRGGLTTNRTFSYLTLSYRIHNLLDKSQFPNQKRYADYFEAYVGAAWIYASETKDLDHVREIENFLSQLFKPRIWPALESLTNGSTDLVTAVQFDQSLKYGGEDDDDDEVAIFEIPPARLVTTKKATKALKRLSKKDRRRKHADILERNRQLDIADRIKAKRSALSNGGYTTPIKYYSQAGPSRASIMRDRSAERRRQSAITNRVAQRSNARSRQPYATPIKSKLGPQSNDAVSCKIFRLKPGDTVEEEVDMDLDSEWEDVKIVPKPNTLNKIDKDTGGLGGTAGLPIVV